VFTSLSRVQFWPAFFRLSSPNHQIRVFFSFPPFFSLRYALGAAGLIPRFASCGYSVLSIVGLDGRGEGQRLCQELFVVTGKQIPGCKQIHREDYFASLPTAAPNRAAVTKNPLWWPSPDVRPLTPFPTVVPLYPPVLPAFGPPIRAPLPRQQRTTPGLPP